MSVITETKFETIKVPVQYKKIFLKIVKQISAEELEEKIFSNNNEFFSKAQEQELISLESYKNLKNTINNKFGFKKIK